MADKYVAKTGSDSNDGNSLGNAYATIGKAIVELGGAGGEAEVHSGHYNEQLSLATANGVTITCVGQVVLDGNGVLGNAIGDSGSSVPAAGRHVFNNIEIRNYSNPTAFLKCNSGSKFLDFNQCRFLGSGLASQAAIGSTAISALDINLNETLISNFDYGVRLYRSGQGVYMSRCTVDCITACFHSTPLSSGLLTATSTLFITDTGDVFRIRNIGYVQLSNYNRFWITGVGNVAYDTGTSTPYQTLAAWQGWGGRDQGSTEGDPSIADRANQIYIPTLASPLIAAGKIVGTGVPENIGSFDPGAGISENANSGLWGANGILTNVVYDSGTGRYKLAVGQVQGSVATDVLDLGQEVRLKNVRLFGLENPLIELSSFDTSLGDEDVTMEIRYSTSSFLKGDGSPSWVELKRNGEVDAIARYVQIRATLRNDNDLV